MICYIVSHKHIGKWFIVLYHICSFHLLYAAGFNPQLISDLVIINFSTFTYIFCIANPPPPWFWCTCDISHLWSYWEGGCWKNNVEGVFEWDYEEKDNKIEVGERESERGVGCYVVERDVSMQGSVELCRDRDTWKRFFMSHPRGWWEPMYWISEWCGSTLTVRSLHVHRRNNKKRISKSELRSRDRNQIVFILHHRLLTHPQVSKQLEEHKRRAKQIVKKKKGIYFETTDLKVGTVSRFVQT